MAEQERDKARLPGQESSSVLVSHTADSEGQGNTDGTSEAACLGSGPRNHV